MGGIDPAILIASLMAASVPILLAALGELVVEKAGVLNLGVEGMMIMGAIVGFMVTIHTESPVLGFVCGALGGAARQIAVAGRRGCRPGVVPGVQSTPEQAERE